ncbi:uncharacterized protein LOC126656948 [Mercurialis annua]|uniref:uncharacterized protein LOC126656948 n=1 Tax=Mercurialis annua TaxID=3986 RepID=UPI0021606840|nr:uncharacterized protein LOC126656948 [Mercurialis annua]
MGSGPYTFDQKPLMLKKWHPRMTMDPNEIRSVPIWIQLPGLPWEFWSTEILSKIGSFCGSPLYCDQCTISKTRLGYARVLVEMDAMGRRLFMNGDLSYVKNVVGWGIPRAIAESHIKKVLEKKEEKDVHEMEAEDQQTDSVISKINVKTSLDMIEKEQKGDISLDDGYRQMIGAWNIRGINNPNKQSEVASLISKNKLQFIGITETRVNSVKFDKVWNCLKSKIPGWGVINNYSCSSIGRIWIIFNKSEIDVDILAVHNQFIHWRVKNDRLSFLCTVVYGSYMAVERVNLWNTLDRVGGIDIDMQAADDFKNWVSESNLLELKKTGNTYTWTNNQSGNDRIWRKLDWCFVNLSWYEDWTDSMAFLITVL